MKIIIILFYFIFLERTYITKFTDLIKFTNLIRLGKINQGPGCFFVLMSERKMKMFNSGGKHIKEIVHQIKFAEKSKIRKREPRARKFLSKFRCTDEELLYIL